MKTTLENCIHIESLLDAYHRNELNYAQNPVVVGFIQDFKKGDVISCLAGHPYKEFAIIQLKTDDPDIDNLTKHITGSSSGQMLTSHIISYQWSLMELNDKF